MNFRHFIITRFNVKIWPMPFPKRLEISWLAERFDLFQKYCFPTVSAQLNQDFTWLVLFDEETPPLYQKIIKAYARYENFTPVFCGEFDTVMPQVTGVIKSMTEDVDWVLTTRLDNDDALSVKYVRCLHSIVKSMNKADLVDKEALFINFTKGLQLSKGVFYDFEDVTNAFVSLIEKKDDLNTVFWVDHPAIHDVAPVMQIETYPLWLQIVHDINVYNYVRGEEMDASKYMSDFKCDFI